MRNKLLSLLGFILLTTPLAATAQQFGDFTYSSDGSAITITGYNGAGGAVIIPATIYGQPVVAIGVQAFRDKTSLTSVTIPSSVASIGNYAFYQCANLTSVTMSNGVTSIGNYAFAFCTSLTSATLPGTVTTIGFYAFFVCRSLTNGTIPGNLISQLSDVFNACTSLVAFTVDSANPYYSSVDGVLFNKYQSVVIQYPGGKAGSYAIPDSVTSIGDLAFYECVNLTSVTIPTGVTSIPNAAFRGCSSLASASIPSSVTSIGSEAFHYCGLTGITIPGSVTSIGSEAFADCTSLTAFIVDAANGSYSSLDGVLFDKGQTALIAYPGGKMGDYAIPGSVTYIGDNAFSSCTGLASVTIPGSVTHIGDDAFASCTSLTNVTIPASATYIGGTPFLNCTSLSAITVDAANPGHSSVDGVLFENSGTWLTECPGGKAGSYAIPAGVTYIRASAFQNCARLTNIMLPASFREIGNSAFSGCTGLNGAFFMGNAPSLGYSAFDGATNATIYYLPGTTGWGPTFAGRPAVLWNPLMESSGVGPAGFGFNITGTADIPIVVEAATSLANSSWIPLQSLNLTNGAFHFSDPDWMNYPARFYRIRSP